MEMYRFRGCGGFTNEVLILEDKAREGAERGSGSVLSRDLFQVVFPCQRGDFYPVVALGAVSRLERSLQ